MAESLTTTIDASGSAPADLEHDARGEDALLEGVSQPLPEA